MSAAILARLAPVALDSPLHVANDTAPGERHGYVLGMWTGLFPLDDCDRPVLFRTVRRALAHLKTCPVWGRTAVMVYRCTVRPNGQGGRPDYILGRAVAYGYEAREAHR